MELDEWLYKGVLRFFKHRSQKKEAANLRKAQLTELKTNLLITARAFTGKPIEIFPAIHEGGYKNDAFFLPPEVDFFEIPEHNALFYYFRVVYLSIQHRLHLNWPNNIAYDLEKARKLSANYSETILQEIRENYPIIYEFYSQAQAILESENHHTSEKIHYLYGKLMQDDRQDTPKPLENFSENLQPADQQKISTQIKAKAVEAIQTVQIDQKAQEDFVLTHNFEKVETAEEFDGTWRDFDGSDDLEQHQDALDELNMKLTVRTDEPSHSVYQAEFIENSAIAESKSMENTQLFVTYPEWSFSRKQYLENYCKVYPQKQTGRNSNYYTQTIEKHQITLNSLRKMLANANNKYVQQRRQSAGTEFDIDALTDRTIDLLARHTPTDKVYLAQRKRETDVSILLLLDTSLSSDGYAAGNRVIDIEKKTAILLGEVLQEFSIPFSIATFSSKTRNHLSYNIVKDFRDSWQKAKYIVGEVQPSGYTRIGGALRHAKQELLKQRETKKWILFFTDGKPNDYDRYEGKYGIHDVKQAVRELHELNINLFTFAVEAQAKYYLPQMFGPTHYKILPDIPALLQVMVGLVHKIKHQ